jgi:hypothetical protein
MTRKLFLSGLAVLGFAVSSQATPELVIWDNAGHSQTILDNQSGDSASASGQIAWIGSIGVWNLDVSVGVTTGTTSQPIIDLSGSSTSSGAGVLTVWYSDNGFGPSFGSVDATIGGTLMSNASLEFTTAYSPTNNLNIGNVLTDNTYTGNPFQGASSASINDNGPYSLIEEVTLTHTTAGNSSYDARLSVPDSASTAILMGLGLISLGFFKRRNKFSKA